MMGSPPPIDEPEKRIEWTIQRARMLELKRGKQWIAEEIKTLWNDPEGFEDGGLYDCPEDVDEEDYALFTLGLVFGTDYEYYYPRENKDEWLDHD